MPQVSCINNGQLALYRDGDGLIIYAGDYITELDLEEVRRWFMGTENVGDFTAPKESNVSVRFVRAVLPSHPEEAQVSYSVKPKSYLPPTGNLCIVPAALLSQTLKALLS
ncbi:hypothetical protein A2368_00605 [Candidatus Collierbacteria bacterium RIFOXYB1_FULL_49_13]|uniref:Uncharacterized protein n=1 Tax=Candidatus Collierbacteria bacterium RIFOXYB1_FULL_49_13 TaxID=1817728 RepID=A0A1F5FHG5_9BACT|nr:MAG: hypothetical protein A2368_00605 [Candidatus Collierbacteria bacterium RIFOXYB1_FULL_49_13]